MFRQYHLHSTSGSSRAASSYPRTPSLSAGSRGGTPAPHLTPGSSQTTSSHAATAASAALFACAPASEEPVDGPISLGVRRRQDDDVAENGSTQLTPQCIKRLKAHAKKLCTDLSIDEKPIFEFIDVSLARPFTSLPHNYTFRLATCFPCLLISKPRSSNMKQATRVRSSKSCKIP